MKHWKAALGLGAACAACCAVPLLGGAALLTAGSATLAAVGAALAACADELAIVGVALLAAGVAIGVIAWRRRRSARSDACAPAASCSTECHTCRPG